MLTSQRPSWENRKDFTSEFEKQNVRAGDVAGGKLHLLSTQETRGYQMRKHRLQRRLVHSEPQQKHQITYCKLPAPVSSLKYPEVINKKTTAESVFQVEANYPSAYQPPNLDRDENRTASE